MLPYPSIESSKINLFWTLQFNLTTPPKPPNNNSNNWITRPNSITIQSSPARERPFSYSWLEFLNQFYSSPAPIFILYGASRSEDRCRNHFSFNWMVFAVLYQFRYTIVVESYLYQSNPLCHWPIVVWFKIYIYIYLQPLDWTIKHPMARSNKDKKNVVRCNYCNTGESTI